MIDLMFIIIQIFLGSIVLTLENKAAVAASTATALSTLKPS
jgi:hypothetical protein